MAVNSDGSYTQTTSTGYFSRIGGSFKGIGAGIVMLIAATGLMWWNEGRAVRTGDAITEAQRATVAMPSPASVDPAFEGKLVHVSGRADTAESLTDPVFGVSVPALKLSREVEYFQWVENAKSETRKKVGGGTETVTNYSYEQRWVNSPVDSTNFKNTQGHENGVLVHGLKNERRQAADVRLGAYRLPEFAVSSIGGSQSFAPQLSEAQLRELGAKLLGGPGTGANVGGIGGALAQASSNAMRGAAQVWPQENGFFLGRSPGQPQVGDIRVKFAMTPPADISLIAQVTGDTFKKFAASGGATFSSLAMGQKDMASMFEGAKKSNSAMTWILRGIGLALAIGAFKVILAPLAVLADVIPLLGKIVGAGTGLVGTILGAAWTCLIVAIAWIRFRPTLGFALLAAAVILTGSVFLLRGKKKNAPPQAAA